MSQHQGLFRIVLQWSAKFGDVLAYRRFLARRWRVLSRQFAGEFTGGKPDRWIGGACQTQALQQTHLHRREGDPFDIIAQGSRDRQRVRRRSVEGPELAATTDRVWHRPQASQQRPRPSYCAKPRDDSGERYPLVLFRFRIDEWGTCHRIRHCLDDTIAGDWPAKAANACGPAGWSDDRTRRRVDLLREVTGDELTVVEEVNRTRQEPTSHAARTKALLAVRGEWRG